MLGREKNWPNPFGDGKAGERIVRTITGGSDD
jgi:UDP-N-acetylglucosamine 2-epimerase